MTEDEAFGQLAPHGVLRAGIAVGPAGSAVWATRDPQTGEPRGVTVDLARLLGERLGLEVELVEHSSSGHVIETAGADRWDVGFAPVDEERKRHVDFAPDYYVGDSTYLVPAGSMVEDVPDVDREGMRVLGVENTATIRSARRSSRHVEVIGLAGLDEALSRFRAGEVDALALGRESILSLLPDLPGARALAGSFHSAGTAMAVPKGRPEALALLVAFTEEAKRDGSIRAIFDRNGMGTASVAPPAGGEASRA